MDHSTFDALARTVATPSSRRRTLGGLLTAALGFVAAPVTKTAAKKKPCPPCKKRQQGKCKGKKPDGTGCAGGTCQGGRCVASASPGPPPPTPCSTDFDCPVREFCQTDTGVCAPCRGAGQSCVAANGGNNTRLCCSQMCVSSLCRDFCPGGSGAECASGRCCIIPPPGQNYCALTPSEVCE